MSGFYDDNHRLRIQMMEIMEDAIRKFDEETDIDKLEVKETIMRDEFSKCMKEFTRLISDTII